MESDVQIRIALADEAEKIAGVLFEAFSPFEGFYTPEAFAATAISPERVRERFDEAGRIWTALKNESMVGTVSVVPEGERLYIRSMAVLPAAQGSGIGRRLLLTIEDFAAQNGFEKLFLYTVPFLTGAIRLYEQNGFERVREGSPDNFFGTPWFEMEKDLTGLTN